MSLSREVKATRQTALLATSEGEYRLVGGEANMHWRLTIAGFLLAAPLYAQQSPGIVRTEYDMDKVVARSSFSDEQLRGRKTFVQRCAICHDPLGQPAGRTIGPWLDAARVKTKGEAALIRTISTGIRGMPGWQYTLEPAQIGYVLEYLKTITPDQRPVGLKYEVDENK